MHVCKHWTAESATDRGEIVFEHAGDELERRRLNHLQQVSAQRVTILLKKSCTTDQ